MHNKQPLQHARHVSTIVLESALEDVVLDVMVDAKENALEAVVQNAPLVQGVLVHV